MIGKSYALGASGTGGSVLKSGWSTREDWGVWSDGHKAKLELPLPESIDAKEVLKIVLNLGAFVGGEHSSTKFSIKSGNTLLWSGSLTETPTDVVIDLPVSDSIDNRIVLSFFIENPASPLEMGISTDARNLGVGLLSFKYIQ